MLIKQNFEFLCINPIQERLHEHMSFVTTLHRPKYVCLPLYVKLSLILYSPLNEDHSSCSQVSQIFDIKFKNDILIFYLKTNRYPLRRKIHNF